MPQLNMTPEQMYGQTQGQDFQSMMTGQPAQMGAVPAPPASMSMEQIQQLGQQGIAQPVAQNPAYPPPGQPGQPAQGIAPAAMPISTITGLPPGAGTYNTAIGQYTDASARQGAAMDAYTGAIGQERTAINQEGQAQQQLAQVQADKGDAMQGVDREREANADSYAAKRQQMMDQFDKTNGVQQQKMQAAVDAAGEASIHDFWADKSTGARILGCIAQALSGAANGLAGNPSAPTPLDRLINDDLQRQMANQQNKRQVAQQQQSVFDTMLRSTGNRLDAETAMYQAANNRVSAMAQTLADKFATPEAAAMAKQFAAQNAQKNAQLEQKRTEMQMRIATQDANASANLMGEAERTNLAAGAAGTKAAGKAAAGQDEYSPLPGMLNGIPKHSQTPGNYTRISKEAEAINSYLTLMGDSRRALQTGGWDAYYNFVAEHNVAYNLMRNATGAGANLTGKEGPINDSFSPGYLKTHLFGNVLGAEQMIKANEDAWGGVLLSKYTTLNPHGGIDVNAPDVGPVLQRIISQRNAGAANAQPTP